MADPDMLTSAALAGIDEPMVGAGGHVVQFYERDESLVDSVSSFLGAGLVAGDTVVVVGTAGHRTTFEAALRAAGINVRAVRRSGQYTELDAQSLMDSFLIDGMPDRERFHATVGELVTRLAASRQPLRIYGEMVALLWDRGAVAGAIALEALWNELGRRADFTLYCAYPAGAMSAMPDEHHAVRAHHAAVVPDPVVQPSLQHEVSQRFEPTLFAGPVARRFATRALKLWRLEQLTDVTELVLTEFVSNAIRHGSLRFRVRLVRRAGGIRLEVSDRSVALPVLIEEDVNPATGGRGIRIVDALCSTWGVDVRADGKTVWAEISAEG